MDAAIWGLLGTIVGALASIVTTWLTNMGLSRREQEKARDERFERASAFQLQTLLDLQESIHDALRLTGRAHLEDQHAHRLNGQEWENSMLSDEVNEGLRLAQRKVSLLVERVADDALRVRVKALMQAFTGVVMSRTEQESRRMLDNSTTEFSQVQEQLGVVLRKHYVLTRET